MSKIKELVSQYESKNIGKNYSQRSQSNNKLKQQNIDKSLEPNILRGINEDEDRYAEVVYREHRDSNAFLPKRKTIIEDGDDIDIGIIQNERYSSNVESVEDSDEVQSIKRDHINPYLQPKRKSTFDDIKDEVNYQDRDFETLEGWDEFQIVKRDHTNPYLQPKRKSIFDDIKEVNYQDQDQDFEDKEEGMTSRYQRFESDEESQSDDTSESSDNFDVNKRDVETSLYVTDSDTDIFGENTFEEEDSEDNYVVESLNKEGQELIVTHIQITRHTVSPGENVEENLKNVIRNSHYIVRRNEIDNVPSSSSSSNRNSGNASNITENNATKMASQRTRVYQEIEVNDDCDDYDNFEQYLDKSETSNYAFSACKPPEDDDDSDKKDKIDYTLEELLKTEETYVNTLRRIVEDYKPYVEKNMPPADIGKTSYLFGNIEEIYKGARKFLAQLERNGNDYENMAQVFIDFQPTFDLYPSYSKNKPTADEYIKHFEAVIKKRQLELKDKLGLPSHLLTPIQRLGKYKLFLEQIKKELEKNKQNSDKIDKAYKIIRNVMERGNDNIAIVSIKNCQVDLYNMGAFKARQEFNIQKPKKFEAMVFLFDSIVVFTENPDKNIEQFRYVDSIPLSELSQRQFDNKTNCFELTHYSKKKRGDSNATYLLEGDPKAIKDWIGLIEQMLLKQLQKAKEQQKSTNYTSPTVHEARTPVTRTTSLTRNKTYRKSEKTRSKFYFLPD